MLYNLLCYVILCYIILYIVILDYNILYPVLYEYIYVYIHILFVGFIDNRGTSACPLRAKTLHIHRPLGASIVHSILFSVAGIATSGHAYVLLLSTEGPSESLHESSLYGHHSSDPLCRQRILLLLLCHGSRSLTISEARKL